MKIPMPSARQVGAAISSLSTAAASSGKMARVAASKAAGKIAEGLSGVGVSGAPGRTAASVPPGRTPFLYGAPPAATHGPLSSVAARVAATSTRLGQIAARLAGLESHSDGTGKADEARVRSKRQEQMEGIADDAIDEAKANYEEAKEQFKLAMRVLSEHMERMTQVTQKITS
jgi:hypothetical protein